MKVLQLPFFFFFFACAPVQLCESISILSSICEGLQLVARKSHVQYVVCNKKKQLQMISFEPSLPGCQKSQCLGLNQFF